MKIKTKTGKSCYCLMLVGLIVLLIGCTNPTVIYRNNTINNTIYRDRNNTITINNTIPCNQSEPEINTTVYDRSYVLSLIRQLKRYEKQQNKFINQSSCMLDLNRTETERDKAEEELCQWNSSWCN